MEYRTSVYPPFALREQAQAAEKIAIAHAAAAMVKPGDTIAIDSGTTAAYLAHVLRDYNAITVISNSLQVLAQLYDVTGIHLISPGGTLSLEGMNAGGGDLSFVGPVANTTLCSFRPEPGFHQRLRRLDHGWYIQCRPVPGGDQAHLNRHLRASRPYHRPYQVWAGVGRDRRRPGAHRPRDHRLPSPCEGR